MRLFIFSVAIAITLTTVSGESPAPSAEHYLHNGEFAAGETALLLALEGNPSDDESRFGLGVIQFIRAVENLGKALHEYGAISANTRQPFLRLPVPKNEQPSTISYKSLGRVLDAFAADLRRAEATLASVQDEDVKLRLRLSKITFNFTDSSETPTTLLKLFTKLNGRPFSFEANNPDLRIHFDRGDVAWLRAYCHLLCGLIEGYRAIDEEAGFEQRVKGIFPKVEPSSRESGLSDWQGLNVVDPPRLRRMRLHLVKVCELNRETWEHIYKETDDDYEWLPATKQTDQLGLPIDADRVQLWLRMMAQWEGLLKGERLIDSRMLIFFHVDHPDTHGLNVKKLLDDPPADIFNLVRIREEGIETKYLDLQAEKQVFDQAAVWAVFSAFNGPFGFATAARLN